MTNAAHGGAGRPSIRSTNSTLTIGWCGTHPWRPMLLATGLGARRNRMLPSPLAWATIVIGASLLTPLGFFGFLLLPLWLIVVGLWLSFRPTLALEPIAV